MRTRSLSGLLALLIVIGLLGGLGCRSTAPEDALLAEIADLDKEQIFALGEELYEEGKYQQARRYYQFVYDSFPYDPLGHRAALRVADTFFQQKDRTSLTEARLRYRDFANRYPNDPQRDYALLMLGHSYFVRKGSPDRDTSNAEEALTAYGQLLALYPDSEHADEARANVNELNEMLAEHEFRVARFYHRNERWVGALWRLRYLERTYPEYSGIDEVREMIEITRNRLLELGVDEKLIEPPSD